MYIFIANASSVNRPLPPPPSAMTTTPHLYADNMGYDSKPALRVVDTPEEPAYSAANSNYVLPVDSRTTPGRTHADGYMIPVDSKLSQPQPGYQVPNNSQAYNDDHTYEMLPAERIYHS